MITTPVTLTTILLPLIAGPTIRYIVRFSYQNRAYARTILIILGLAGEILMAVMIPGFPHIIIFGTSYGGMALVMLVRASWIARNQRLWGTFSAVVAYSILSHFIVGAIGINGIVPLVYLVLAVYRSEITRHLLSNQIGLLLKKKLARIKGLEWIQRAFYYTVAWLISFRTSLYWDWRASILLVFSVPLGVLAINRLIRSSVTRENRGWWYFYTILYGSSLVLSIYNLWLFLPLVPAVYLVVFSIYFDHPTFFNSLIRRLKRLRRQEQLSLEISENRHPFGGSATSNSAMA